MARRKRLGTAGRIWRSIWKNIVWILAVGLICADFMFAYMYVIVTPVYSATAELTISIPADVEMTEETIDSYTQSLLTDEMLEEVINNLEMNTTVEDLRDAVGVSAEVNSEDSSMKLYVSTRNTDTYVAMRVSGEIVKLSEKSLMRASLGGTVTETDGPWTTGNPVSPARRRMTGLAGIAGALFMTVILVIRGIAVRNMYK